MSLLTTVGRYEITGELGRGAMGVVYKAKDPTIGRTVALKTMRLDVHGLESAEMVRRFQNEARAAGLLSHSNIVTIYDAGEQDGIFYIAMEFIQGTTLHELLTEQRILASDEVVQYSRQICRGLDYAHSHGIVHRDCEAGQHHDHRQRHDKDHGFWHCQGRRQHDFHRSGPGYAELHGARAGERAAARRTV